MPNAQGMRAVLALGLATLVLFAIIAIYLLPLAPGIVALQFTFSKAAFTAVTAKWQAGGVALFRSHMPADFVLLVMYATFGWLLGSRWPRAQLAGVSIHRAIRWSLPVAALGDATENALHLLLTSGEPIASQLLYPMAGIAASIKWLGILVFVIAVAAATRSRAA